MPPQPRLEALARPRRRDSLPHCGRQVYQLRSGSGTGLSFRSLAIAIAASTSISERVLVEIAANCLAASLASSHRAPMTEAAPELRNPLTSSSESSPLLTTSSLDPQPMSRMSHARKSVM
ncbi:hypothetical protein DL765_004657 [Monosporascus sp. GIB2]|nr:hypothetical protein DL765_004657 [Monosporascus sp. GIB2]